MLDMLKMGFGIALLIILPVALLVNIGLLINQIMEDEYKKRK